MIINRRLHRLSLLLRSPQHLNVNPCSKQFSKTMQKLALSCVLQSEDTIAQIAAATCFCLGMYPECQVQKTVCSISKQIVPRRDLFVLGEGGGGN